MTFQPEETVLGIELGSTRIKAVLIDGDHHPVAGGSFSWENRFEDGVWVYHTEDAVSGLRACYADLKRDVRERYGITLTKVQAIGISGMMHGYLVLDREGRQLAPFRTWRNTITAQASEKLSALFRFNIPQRWSIAHLYQAILNGETHVPDIAHLVTLSVYIHHLLTGTWAVGIDEASGMFPYDDRIKDFDRERVGAFEGLIADCGFPWKLRDILPAVYPAGAVAGNLTGEGAKLLDPDGDLCAGIPFCAPEGDAGTGMVATGAVEPRTGSISAGTSAFSLQVLEKPLKGYYPEIDVVATPAGKPVAMAHTNNCTGEIDAWTKLFSEVAALTGGNADPAELFPKLYEAGMRGDPDCGEMVAFNYAAGEVLTKTEQGRPLFVRMPDSRFTLANFMRAQLNGAIATLKAGLDYLEEQEQVETDRMLAHGGFFKTPGTGQQILADALNIPISVMETAGEGGPWGMALLAAYMCRKQENETLEAYLANHVFRDAKTLTCEPDPAGTEGFGRYYDLYRAALRAEQAAADMGGSGHENG